MEGEPTLRLRVFDLNCWAIRYLSKRRQERVRLIGDTLCREGFDLVLLQEVWSEQDYGDLRVKLAGCYPFSHYFRSGVIGSGLCVFSRFPILDTLLYQYSLNGYPYMLQHGDWFCGKSVGLVIMKISGITFNVYVTHLHAEYCREKDAYLPHRLVQAWELAQFIRHTSKAADVVLLGGDLNMHPEDVGIRLLRGWTGLQDAFAEATRFEGCKNGCTLVPDNCFTDKSELLPFPLGIRIDYILYKAISSFTVKCEELKTTTGPAPGTDIPFSDHEAVMTTLHIQRRGQPVGATLGTADLADVVTEARTEVGVGLRAAQRQRYSSGRMAVLALLLLLAAGVTYSCGGLRGPADPGGMSLHVTPVGLLLLSVYCLISGLSAVYTEAILKAQALPLSLQNIFLYFFGVLLNLMGSVWSTTAGGFLEGFTPWVLLVVLSQALNGLIMSVVMKHSSNITRLFVISCSILVNALLSVALFNLQLTLLFFVAVACIGLAVHLYYGVT